MSDPYVEYQVGTTPEDTFVVPFQFWEKDDLYVEVGGVQELNFNITGAGDPTGGTIILVTPVTNTLVSIQRFTTVLRITDFPIAGPFRIEALNDEFDHIYAILQDLEFFQENVTIPWDNITGKPSTFPPDPHTHPWDEVTDKPADFPPSPHTHVEAEITDLDKYTQAEVDASQAAQDLLLNDAMLWKGEWLQQTYEKNEVVLDWPYTMIANKQTDDRAAPQAAGTEQPVYTGDSPTAVLASAKTLLVANTYTLPTPLIVTNVRVYTVTGNFYSVYLKDNSTGAITELRSFIADATGWVLIATPGNIIPEGATFDLGSYVQEPDPTPTIFTGDWNYSTPNNATVPVAGQATHSDKEKNELRFHKTDNDSVDRGAELLAMDVGDTIETGNIRWSISAIVDNGTYVSFTVAPQQQSTDGLNSFFFETVTATPITTMVDPDYYAGNTSVSPYYSIDGGANLGTDDALGIDIVYQTVSVSPDWDIVSTAGAAGTGGGGGSGGASITIGDTFPTSPPPIGSLHYLTAQPVGMYVYYDDGTSIQWVQTNGAGSVPGDEYRAVKLTMAANYTHQGTNTVPTLVRFDTAEFFGTPFALVSDPPNTVTLQEGGLYRVSYNLVPVTPSSVNDSYDFGALVASQPFTADGFPETHSRYLMLNSTSFTNSTIGQGNGSMVKRFQASESIYLEATFVAHSGVIGSPPDFLAGFQQLLVERIGD